MNTIPVPITAIFTGLMALMLVGLSIRVVVLRAGKKLSYLDGGDRTLGYAIRAQGNFAEYVPMALAVIGLVEWLGVKPWGVYALCIALLASRIVHMWGLYAGAQSGRVIGTSVTWIVIAIAGLLVIGLVA